MLRKWTRREPRTPPSWQQVLIGLAGAILLVLIVVKLLDGIMHLRWMV